MAIGEEKFAGLVDTFSKTKGVESGQMFGKACLKIGGKAFLAQQKDDLAFKLTGAHHMVAMKITGAKLWDPSGAGRPMKEWAAIPAKAKVDFEVLAKEAMSYVKASL